MTCTAWHCAQFTYMSSIGTESCLPGEGHAGQSAQVEHLAQMHAHQIRDVSVVVIDLVRTHGLAEKRVAGGTPDVLENLDHLVEDICARHTSWEILVDSLGAFLVHAHQLLNSLAILRDDGSAVDCH